MSHAHKVYDTDAHFVIDTATRAIKNGTGKTVIVQNDHNSERFSFEIPRMVEGHDMSLCDKVEILYNNIQASDKKKNFNRYIVSDLALNPNDEENVMFSWLISDRATQYAGSLEFSVRFYCSNDYVWNTAITSEIKVVTGMPKTNDMETTPEEMLSEIENAIDESGVIEYDSAF